MPNTLIVTKKVRSKVNNSIRPVVDTVVLHPIHDCHLPTIYIEGARDQRYFEPRGQGI